ncbi:MAG: tRNA glutamyl-Q synthetase [Flavobacteriales bacterium]|nr:tRNA glutamyl-Q synthetase [Flavobacteriales bacterium]
MPRTRIAPTPSGFLHPGNAINFLITDEIAHSIGASIRLRIDDIDAERMRSAFVADVFDSLRWLGIDWQEGPRDAADHERSFSLHGRIGRYLEQVDLLKEQGDLYPCTCSRTELRNGRCACRSKSLRFDDHYAAWRLRLPQDAEVRVVDLIGRERWLRPAALMPDPVLRQRAELGARPVYQIASLIDDVDHGITHIVRGADLLPSTVCQLYLAERLGLESFQQVAFLHHPLITDSKGAKLSKSAGAASLKAMRAKGQGPDGLRDQATDLLQAMRDEADQSSVP